MMAGDETRKGPWTEQEDLQLSCFVGLFGERRWDFIAKVSGLNRTGKSCRLRWVNYLHPGLKRGKLTPQEEKLVLDLHSRWGNRWSRIARRLPGRTDNEIKNYWRTHMRKKAQERKRNLSASSSSSSLCHASPPTTPLKDDMTKIGNVKRSDSSGAAFGSLEESLGGAPPSCYMDQLWQEIDSFDAVTGVHRIETGLLEGGQNTSMSRPCCDAIMEPQVIWDAGCDSLWRMDEDEDKLWHSMADLCVTHNQRTS